MAERWRNQSELIRGFKIAFQGDKAVIKNYNLCSNQQFGCQTLFEQRSFSRLVSGKTRLSGLNISSEKYKQNKKNP